MLDEAVAVVLAPTDTARRPGGVGVFQLHPDGLRVIGGCAQRGHHPHDACAPSGAPLYEEASHVAYDEQVGFAVVDLRGGAGGGQGAAGLPPPPPPPQQQFAQSYRPSY